MAFFAQVGNGLSRPGSGGSLDLWPDPGRRGRRSIGRLITGWYGPCFPRLRGAADERPLCTRDRLGRSPEQARRGQQMRVWRGGAGGGVVFAVAILSGGGGAGRKNGSGVGPLSGAPAP